MTKFSVLVVGVVVAFFVLNSQYLEYLPKFSLAAIMIFSGWKMIMGLWHVAHYGQYAIILATICGLLVYKVGFLRGYSSPWRCTASSIMLLQAGG
jgi:MFS superfamily sulfate permease-like transporter